MDSFQLFDRFSTGHTVKKPALGKSTQTHDGHGGSPLTRLVSIAMALDVNILPLKWRPHLEGLGRGATGAVHQSPLNADVSFAFKRFVDFSESCSDLLEEDFLLSEYGAISSEVVILSHPEIYHHPNVINLEGLCWEIVADSSNIRPVLVFRKAEGGSLDIFLTGNRTHDLSFEDRLEICGEIAKGMRILHLCGIVHGDLKPENILIFGSPEKDIYGVKISDFGYSHYGADDELVKLPESRPWQAPEYSDRHVSLGSAKKMDVFSFGLLVLWILFMEESLNLDDGSTTTVHALFSGRDLYAQELLERYKYEGSLLILASQLVSRKTSLAARVHRSLQTVFETSLEKNHEKRASDMQSFVQLFCENESLEDIDRTHSNHTVQLPDWHGKMDISKCLLDFDACDFRVQSSIARALTVTAKCMDCDLCSQNAAFQLAICHTFGFGLDVSTEDCNNWLHRSRKTQIDLERVVSEIKHAKPNLATMSQILSLGYQSNKGSEYYEDGILDEALRRYREMARARESVFGRSHFAARRMYGQFADLLAFDRQFEEAETIYKEEVQISGPQSDELPLIQSKLGRIYTRLGKIEEAKSVFSQLLSSFDESKKQNFSLKMRATRDWSALILKQGDSKGAIKAALPAIEESTIYLGPFHDITWGIKGILADAYIRDGNLKGAIHIIEEVIKQHREAFGKDHHDTVEWMSRLGPLHVELKDWEKARDCFRDVFESLCRSQTIPGNTLLRLIAHSNYMGALVRTGDAETAAPKLRDILSELVTWLPGDHVDVLASKNNLSIAYQHLQMYKDAEPIQREVLHGFQEKLAPGDGRSLRALGNLSDTLYNLKNWEDTARYSTEEINIRKSQSLAEDEDFLRALQKASRSSAHLRLWDNTVDILRQELELRKTLSMLLTTDGLEATALLAVAYMQVGDLESGLVEIGEFFERFLEVQKARQSLLDIIRTLSDLCDTRQRYAEAEELLKLAVLVRQNLYPDQEGGNEDRADEAKIRQLVWRQGKQIGEIRFDPTGIIERARMSRPQTF